MKAKGYDIEEVDKGRGVVGQNLLRLLQEPADIMPVDTSQINNEPEITMMRRNKVGSHKKNQLEDRDLESKEVVRTVVENIPQDILLQTTLKMKKVYFKEDPGELRANRVLVERRRQ